MKHFFCAFLLFVVLSTPTFSQKYSAEPKAQHWVDSVLNTLNLEEKIGQLFMVAAYSSGNEQHYNALEQLIENYNIGGLIFMQGGPLRQAYLTNRFQSLSRLPLLIGMDMEWGLGMRLDSTISFPKQMTLGAVQNEHLIYEMGLEIGRQMQRLGVNVGFAPVVDINSNPKNPVIGIRSFGENVQEVSKRTIAYMNGLKDAGVIAVAKHFPGHGDTEIDSHKSLPTISVSKNILLERELKPYIKLIGSGLDGIMTSHLYVPAIEENKGTPASLSQKVVKELLRHEMNFKGLIFTDALNMKAISNSFQNGSAELEAFKAGNDILLFSTQVPATIKKIKKAVRKNTELHQQLNSSVRKILMYKYELNRSWKEHINTDNLISSLNNADAKALKYNLYKNAVVTVKNTANAVPIKELDSKFFASLSIGESDTFLKTLDDYTFFAHYDYNEFNEATLLKQLNSFDAVVVGAFGKIDARLQAFLNKIARYTTVIVCYAGTSYNVKTLDNVSTIIHVEENNIITQILLAEAVFGAIETTGRLPVSVSEELPQGSGISTTSTLRLSRDLPENVGMDSQTLEQIDEILEEAIQDAATPGGQVLVARKGRIIYEKNFGHYTYDSLKPVSSRTIYDIASITKVAATLQALMFLYERADIDLEKKLSFYLTDLKGTNKEHMLIIDILTHQAGLWPYLPFWKQTLEDSTFINDFYSKGLENKFQYQVAPGLYANNNIKDSVWMWVKGSKVISKKDREPYPYRYSDMGYYLLQRLVEKTINQNMEQFLHQNIYNPLGMTSTGYLPLCNFPLSRIAPTEQDNYFRNTLVYGMVHDQGAALIGGVAGHAGLFSNAIDLAKLMQMHLQGGTYGGYRFLQPGTIGLFTKQQYAFNRRGIGWDKPSKAQWYGPSSRFASGKTFGHTGFTGTAAWVDPKFDLVYIFLSNRIHPDASNRKLIRKNIRSRIQEVIYESIWEYEQYNCID
ncbi:MAG: glycoside hydrolase family 3 N-terminal domain-containing protein [Bacteroidota bacterium]